MANFLEEFTRANGSRVDAGQSDSGHSYDLNPDFKIVNGRAYYEGSGSDLLLHVSNYTCPAEFNINIDSYVFTNVNQNSVGFCADGPNLQNGYLLLQGNVGGIAKLTLYRITDGTFLGTAAWNITPFSAPQQLARVRVQVRANTIEVFYDDVSVISVTDPVHPREGSILYRAAGTGSETTGYHLDRVSVAALVPPYPSGLYQLNATFTAPDLSTNTATGTMRIVDAAIELEIADDYDEALEINPSNFVTLGHISKTQTLYPIAFSPEVVVQPEPVVAQLGHITKTQTLYPITTIVEYVISNISIIRAGEPFTVTVLGTVDLSLPAVVFLDFGGASLAAQTQTGNTATFIAPDSALEHGVIHNLILSVDGELSPVYEALLLAPSGKKLTTFATIDPESWLSGPPYTGNAGGDGFNVGTDDQIFYDAVTTPGGYPANVDENGIASMDDGGAATESQTIEWYYLDAQAGYAKSGSQVFTLEVAIAVVAQLGHISKTQTLYPITTVVELGPVIAQLGHISKTQTIYPISFYSDIGDPSDLPAITAPAPLIVMYPPGLSKLPIGHIDVQNWLQAWTARDVNQNILDLSFNLPGLIPVANSPITVYATAIDSANRVKTATSTITIQQLSNVNALQLLEDQALNSYAQKGSRYYELDD